MSYGGLFSEANKLYARNQHEDAVTASGIFDRRAAKFRVDSHSYFVVNLLEAPFDKLTALNNVEGLRPPLLRVMQNIGH